MRPAMSSISIALAQFAHVGDVLFRGSIGRSDLPGGDHATLILSIRDKLLPLGDMSASSAATDRGPLRR